MTPRDTPVAPTTPRDRLFDEVDERFGRNVARFVDGRLDDLLAEARASAPLDASLYHETMHGVRGVTVHAFCGCEAVAETYNRLARLTTTDEGAE